MSDNTLIGFMGIAFLLVAVFAAWAIWDEYR